MISAAPPRPISHNAELAPQLLSAFAMANPTARSPDGIMSHQFQLPLCARGPMLARFASESSSSDRRISMCSERHGAASTSPCADRMDAL